jgi:hypothetical protein
VAEGRLQPVRVQVGQRRELHGDERGIADADGQQPDPDADPLGDRQCRRCRAGTGMEEAVLGDPELVEAQCLGLARRRGQLADRALR